MLECGTIAGEKGAFQQQQRCTGGRFEQRGDGGGRDDGLRHLDGLVHRQCVGVGDQADERFGRQSLLPIGWHVSGQRERDVDHRMGIRLATGLAQHPDAQRACIIVQAERVGDMRWAFGFDVVEHDGARGKAVEDQVVERGQHPSAGVLRPRDDEGATTAIALDDPIGDEHVERRPDGEAADVELLHEGFVGRNLIAHAPVAASGNHPAQASVANALSPPLPASLCVVLAAQPTASPPPCTRRRTRTRRWRRNHAGRTPPGTASGCR